MSVNLESPVNNEVLATEESRFEEHIGDAVAEDVYFFIESNKWAFFVTIMAIISVYIISKISFLTWTDAMLNWAGWIIKSIFFVYMPIASLRRERNFLDNYYIVFCLAGLIVGGIVAILKILWWRDSWSFLNFFIEPIISALASVAIGFIVSFVFSKINKATRITRSASGRTE